MEVIADGHQRDLHARGQGAACLTICIPTRSGLRLSRRVVGREHRIRLRVAPVCRRRMARLARPWANIANPGFTSTGVGVAASRSSRCTWTRRLRRRRRASNRQEVGSRRCSSSIPYPRTLDQIFSPETRARLEALAAGHLARRATRGNRAGRIGAARVDRGGRPDRAARRTAGTRTPAARGAQRRGQLPDERRLRRVLRPGDRGARDRPGIRPAGSGARARDGARRGPGRSPRRCRDPRGGRDDVRRRGQRGLVPARRQDGRDRRLRQPRTRRCCRCSRPFGCELLGARSLAPRRRADGARGRAGGARRTVRSQPGRLHPLPGDDGERRLDRRACFDAMAPGSVVVLVSRAAVVDWPALLAAAARGHIRAAIDVFPEEPIPAASRHGRRPGQSSPRTAPATCPKSGGRWARWSPTTWRRSPPGGSRSACSAPIRSPSTGCARDRSADRGEAHSLAPVQTGPGYLRRGGLLRRRLPRRPASSQRACPGGRLGRGLRRPRRRRRSCRRSSRRPRASAPMRRPTGRRASSRTPRSTRQPGRWSRGDEAELAGRAFLDDELSGHGCLSFRGVGAVRGEWLHAGRRAAASRACGRGEPEAATLAAWRPGASASSCSPS